MGELLDIDDNPLHTPSVEGPNSSPTGSRIDTFTGNYAAGFPDTPDPQWLLDEAERFRLQRLASAGLAAVEALDDTDLPA
jgi:hypothetical protein